MPTSPSRRRCPWVARSRRGCRVASEWRRDRGAHRGESSPARTVRLRAGGRDRNRSWPPTAGRWRERRHGRRDACRSTTGRSSRTTLLRVGRCRKEGSSTSSGNLPTGGDRVCPPAHSRATEHRWGVGYPEIRHPSRCCGCRGDVAGSTHYPSPTTPSGSIATEPACVASSPERRRR